MKFGVGMPGLILYPPVMSRWEPGARPEEIVRVAQKADALGYDFLTVSEHIVMPTEMAAIMGPRFPDSFTGIAFLAGATKRIRVLTYILVLPYRNAVLLAKGVSTLDFMSGGRVILGTAAGHLEREFDILKVPYHERGAMTDEYLRAMKELWTADEPSFQGRYVQFDRIVFEPKPVQKPHPPVWIGGNTKAAMRRAANMGDGWLPWLIGRQQIPQCLEYIRQQPGFQKRNRPFDVVMPLATFQVEDYSHRELGKTIMPTTRDQIIEEVGLMKEAGVTGTLINVPRTKSADQFIEWLEWFAAEIFPAARK